MHRYQVKYFDGRNPLSQQADAYLENGYLVIVTSEKVLGRWPVGSLFRDSSHLVSTFVGCGTDDARIEISNVELLKELNIPSQVWSMENLLKMKRWIAVWILIVFGFIAVFIWQSRLVSQIIALRIPPATEKALFDKLGIEEHFKICPFTDSQHSSMDKIVRRLIRPNDPQVPIVRVADMPTENAFTLPGGNILILNELLYHAQTPEELAGVLAHEIEHLERRHVMEAMVRAGLYTALLNFSFGDFSSVVLMDPHTVAQFYNLRLTREMENEADTGAIVRLQAAHISTAGAVAFFKRIEKKSSQPKTMEFLYTHPLTGARIQLYERAHVTQTDPPLLTTEEWKDLQSVCQKTEN